MSTVATVQAQDWGVVTAYQLSAQSALRSLGTSPNFRISLTCRRYDSQSHLVVL